MNVIRTLSYGCILAVGIGLLPSRATGAEIQSVKVRLSNTPSAVDRTMSGTRSAQFADDATMSGGETVEVYWTPGRGSVKAGSSVTLEYRRAYSDELYNEVRPINATTGVSRKTLFNVETADSAQFDGPILMWRVRLVQEGKVLAEKTSANWR